MTYPISKFVEAAEALREEYENAEVTSSDTTLTVSHTVVSEEGATYKYGIEFTPPDAEYDKQLVEIYVEDLYETLYGEDEYYEDEGKMRKVMKMTTNSGEDESDSYSVSFAL